MNLLPLHKLRRFRSLPPGEKRLFLEAWTTLGLMRLAIMTVSFKLLTRNMTQSRGAVDPRDIPPSHLDMARKIGRIIAMAARNTPWESACLVQALTAQRMLKRRGIPGLLHLGVAKGNSVIDSMEAHAWTRCGPEVITGESGQEKHTPLTVFGWK